MHSNAAAIQTADASAEVLIVGDGIIGLAIAFELLHAGVRCRVAGTRRVGAASGAAAGLLAPSVGHVPSDARPFFEASLGAYPEFVARLNPFEPSLRLLSGLLELSSSEAADPASASSARRLSAVQLADLEPALLAPRGARLYEHDGAVDNQLLVRALRAALERGGVKLDLELDVESLEVGRFLVANTCSGERITARWIVLAAGAWTPAIRGLPRSLPVEPLKGQMLAVARPRGTPALRHPVMADAVYVVPRDYEIVIGATAERAGFDLAVHDDAIAALRRSAASFCPALGDGPILRAWAGVRPATPDMLPIIGPDPEVPNLLYACGHSKNGILLAPATAGAIRDSILGVARPETLSRFSVRRFA